MILLKAIVIVSIFLCDSMDVYQTPGTTGSYLSMTRHPGPTDFNEISVCLRYAMQTKTKRS